MRPPREAPAREALEAQPEALTIIDEQLEGRAAAVAKQKDRSRERVVVEAVAAQRGERINAFAKVDRLISEHDLKLWGELDHDSRTKKGLAEGFELSRVSGRQMKGETRAVSTLEEQTGGRVSNGIAARYKVCGGELQKR